MKFTDVLDQLNINYRAEGQHTRPGWLQLDCPFCGGELYLGYNLENRYMNCWRCGPHRPVETLMKLTGRGFGDFKELIRDIERERPTRADGSPKRMAAKLPAGLSPLWAAHKSYLRDRGFVPRELQTLWGIQAIGLSSKLAWRIFIPITLNGVVVSWTTRTISDKDRTRYISCPGEDEAVNHKELLYGEDYCRHVCIVCEGPFDVWRIGPGAVCTFGTGYKSAQVKRMAKYPVRVICYDDEVDAQNRAQDLATSLSVLPGETFNVVLDGKDPASAEPGEIEKLRKRFL